jgi:hypothetical protein
VYPLQEHLGIVYEPKAELQFDYLLDSDFRYLDEPAIYERLIAAAPEQVGVEMGFEGKIYYVFATKQRHDGPLPLWISYKVERDKHLITIFDIQQHPRDRKNRK